jgi:hypothetical protein
MRNLKLVFTFLCVCASAHTQIGFNLTHTFDPSVSIHSSVIEKKDTLIVFGQRLTETGHVLNQRYLRFCNPLTGDIYRDVNLSDTSGYALSHTGIESISHKKSIYFLNGRIEYNNATSAKLQKLDAFGNEIWNKQYNIGNYYASFSDIEIINDSVLLLTGQIESSFGNLDVRLLWIDTNGTVINERVYPKPFIQYAWSIDKYMNGDIFLSSATATNTSNSGIRSFTRLKPNGDIIWNTNVGGSGDYNCGQSFLSPNDSSIYYFGNYAYPGQILRPRILKLNAAGDTLWSYCYPKYNAIDVINVANAYEFGALGANNNIIGLLRYKDSITNNIRYILQGLTTDGVPKWERKISIRTNDNYTTSLKKMTNGDFVFTGYVFAEFQNGTVEDGWLVRVNCIGLHEHPVDSISISGQFQSVQLNNFANHFSHATVDWGDGSPIEIQESNYSDSLEHVIFNHTYSSQGNYDVTVKTIACNDTLTHQIPIELLSSGLDNDLLNVFPNPNNGEFSLMLKHDGNAEIAIYDNIGKLIFIKSEIDLNQPQKITVDNLSNGIYHVVVRTATAQFMTKIKVIK